MLLRATELRKSFRSIGRSLNVDQGTVRNRIRKLKQDGLIREWRLEVNPGLFGRKLECLMLDVPQEYDKVEVIRKICSVSSVTLVCNYMGPPLHVRVSCENDQSLRETRRIITEIVGGEQPVWAQRPTSTIRASDLKQSDWQIIKALRKDPWKSYEQIAKEVGISSKTARKRTAAIAEQGAIQLSVDVNIAALKGVVPASLVVFYSSPTSRSQAVRRITDYLGDELFFAELGDPHVGVFALSVPNVARLEAVGGWVRSQPGITACRTLVLLDVTPVHLMEEEEEVEKMVFETARSRIAYIPRAINLRN